MNGIIAAQMFASVIMGIFFLGVLYIAYMFTRPSIKRAEYNQTYYIAKLKEHARKSNLDLDSELKVLFRTPKMILKEEYINTYESSALITDEIIAELDKKYVKAKK